MDIGSTNNNVLGKGKKYDKSRWVWTVKEEEVVLEALKDAITKSWKSENGFRPGFFKFLEDEMKMVFPTTDLRGNLHINSKIHVWKRTHGTLITMLSRSGIGWNEFEKMIEASDEAWESLVKSDKTACQMLYKQWPYYNDWCEIFGNDRATGEHADSFASALQGVLNMETNVPPEVQVGLDELFNGFEEAAESMSPSSPPPCNASASKQTSSKKRKKQSQGEELFVAAIDKFTEMMWSTMSDLVTRISVEYDSVNAIKDVFDALGRILELSKKERIDAAALLVEKPKQLTLFFSLPDDARLDLVRRILDE